MIDFQNITLKIKQSDQASFKHLFEMMHQDLFNFIYYKTADQDLAEDVLQETFVKLWERRESLDDKRSIKSLIYQIAKNLITDTYRHQQVVLSYEAEQQAKDQAKAEDPETQFLSSEEMDSLLSHISELPEKMRLVFMLNRMDGLSNSEIAERLDLSKRTVENQLFKATQTLKKVITEKKDE